MIKLYEKNDKILNKKNNNNFVLPHHRTQDYIPSFPFPLMALV